MSRNAVLVLVLLAGSSGSPALAQSYTPPSGIPTAAALGVSASPLVGQGYLPLERMQGGLPPIDPSRAEHRHGVRHQLR